MRDENNRNTLADLTYLEFEAKRKVEDTDLIPQDDLRDVNTYTEQSLSSEDADHIAYDQNEAAPADAKPEERMNPDHSAIDAWEATGADPDQRTIADERISSPADAGEADEVRLDRTADETVIRDVADDKTDREWRAIEGEPQLVRVTRSSPSTPAIRSGESQPTQRCQAAVPPFESGHFYELPFGW